MKKNLTLDLQLFAYDPQAQPANYTGAATLAAEDKMFYDKSLIRYATPNLVHDQFGQKRDIPPRSGQKVEFRCFASLGKQTKPLVEGVTPDGQTLSITTVEATVHQYGGFVETTDMLQLASIDPVIEETVRLIGDQAGLSMDTVVRDVLNTGLNVAYACTYSGDTENKVYFRHELNETAKLTVKEVEKISTYLRSQNAPTIDGYYICIAHPMSLFDLKRDPEWRDAQKYTDNVEKLFTSEVGTIGKCRFVESTEAKIFKGADLSADSRTLTVSGAVTASNKIKFTGGTVATDELKGRFIIVDGERYQVVSNTDTEITVDSSFSCADKVVIYPGEGGAEGCAVFSNLFFGRDAYGTTEITGGGLETIIKQLGSAGTADPLDQRATIGWKGLKTAEILIPQYLIRLETAGTYANEVKAN